MKTYLIKRQKSLMAKKADLVERSQKSEDLARTGRYFQGGGDTLTGPGLLCYSSSFPRTKQRLGTDLVLREYL